MPERAQALAWYDHPFFGRWPAITRNDYGSGTLTYEGTWLSDTLQRHVVRDVLDRAGLTDPDQQLPGAVRVKHGVNDFGKHLRYYLNYSGDVQSFTYSYDDGTDLLTGRAIPAAQRVTLHPWDLVIVEEK
jgi:beta-galactosidase